MKTKKWLELISKNKEKIIETAINAYKDAIQNTNLRYIVEMTEEEDIYYWYDIAGGNTYHMSVHNGTALELMCFCFQYYELEITDTSIINKLKEKSLENYIEKLKTEAEEEYTSIKNIISKNYSELQNVIDDCEKESISFEVSEYARERVEEELRQLEKDLERKCDEENL